MAFLDLFRPAPSRTRIEPVLRRDQALVTRATASSSDTFATAPWLFGALGGFGSSAGVPVTPTTALAAPVAYACIRRLAEDIAKLPLQVRRRLPAGGWEEDGAHPLNRLFARPNRWQTAFHFKAHLVTAYCLRGNAYAVIVRGEDGRPLALVPVSPDRVGVYLSPEGWLFYSVTHPLVGDGLLIHRDDMIHLRNSVSLDGYTGLSPIAAGQEAFGLALATQQHGAVLFRQGAQAAGVLKAPGVLSQEAAQRLAQSWQTVYGGVGNAHRTAVLEGGVTYERLAMTSDESQFLETRKLQIAEICRIFAVPPHKVMDNSQASYNSLEVANTAYVDDALSPIATQIEEEIAANLLFREERGALQVKFSFAELLRGDTASRYASYATAVTNGWLSIDEVRALEGRGPVPGGDVHRMPLNTGALGSAKPTDPAAITAPPGK